MLTPELRAALELALANIRDEVVLAYGKFKPFNSPHEGYAVILEELDELWDEVKGNTGRHESARVEARQIAAMAVRYMLDVARA